MTGVGDGQREAGVDRVIVHAERVKTIWELVTWAIAVGSSIGAFIKNVGGPIQFLVEVGVFGVTSYISLFVFGIPIVLLLGVLEDHFDREPTGLLLGVLAVLVALGGGALFRFVLFADGSTDLDGVGTAFAAAIGAAILLTPLLLLAYFKGTRPAR